MSLKWSDDLNIYENEKEKVVESDTKGVSVRFVIDLRKDGELNT